MLDEAGDERHAPAALPPWKIPGTYRTGSWVSPTAGRQYAAEGTRTYSYDCYIPHTLLADRPQGIPVCIKHGWDSTVVIALTERAGRPTILAGQEISSPKCPASNPPGSRAVFLGVNGRVVKFTVYLKWSRG